MSFAKIISEHIDDAARTTWAAELRGPLSLILRQWATATRLASLVTFQGRLQISADLDVKSLGKLKQMLEQYEQILKLL